MPQLPDRPDLAQLRRQARELHRAAVGGEAEAVRRVRRVSEKTTLSTAQLAIAREYGFPSWPKLKDEVLGAERRRVPADADGPGAPDFLTGDDGELIDGQYTDRPQLRPILDAVLAALPALGPVTVQARKTFVSLVSPRRTFAVVQATTRTRVDLGLRLDGVEPGGRLQAARDIGAATVRIALSGPGEFDDEAFGWLRRAYEVNTAPPPPPRRPAPRPRAEPRPLVVVIEGYDLPGRSCRPGPDGTGYHNVHVALPSKVKERPGLTVPERRWQAAEAVPGDADSARWEVDVKIRRGDDGIDFGGPFVSGDRTDRNLGLAWGEVPGDGTFRLFRGAKLRLVDVDPVIVEDALRPGHQLVARVRLTDARGNPICARVRPPDIAWSAERAEPPPGPR